MPTVELFGRHEVLQVFVISPDFASVFRTFDEMPPLLQSANDGEHLLVVDLIVPFDWG